MDMHNAIVHIQEIKCHRTMDMNIHTIQHLDIHRDWLVIVE
jgi:hypothetical protein